jgi:hypothetical protein
MESQKMITVTYLAVDGTRDTRRYKTLRGAQARAHYWVGPHPDIGSFYAVSNDGVGRVTVEGGTTLAELFPETDDRERSRRRREHMRQAARDLFP